MKMSFCLARLGNKKTDVICTPVPGRYKWCKFLLLLFALDDECHTCNTEQKTAHLANGCEDIEHCVNCRNPFQDRIQNMDHH